MKLCIVYDDQAKPEEPAIVIHPTPRWVGRFSSEEDACKALIEKHRKRGRIPESVTPVVADRAAIPSDRTFRDAWEAPKGKIAVSMEKARTIHMNRIRAVRDRELAKLDVPFMQAVERDDTAEKARLAAEKQKLRDLPQTFDLSKAKTPDELKVLWPAELIGK